MKMNITLMMMLTCFLSNAQVGINTTEPQATLDVNGNIIIRQLDPAPVSGSYDFLVLNQTTKEVEKVSGNIGSQNVNTTMAKAVEADGVSLLSGTLFAGWQKINFDSGNIPINPGSNFSATTDFYTVPSSGVYVVNYEFRYGSGVMLSALNFSGIPSIGILSHNSSGYTVLEQKKFSGVSVPLLASIIISDAGINTMYQLTAGEQLSFELNAGGLALGLLGSSYATVSIYKISD